MKKGRQIPTYSVVLPYKKSKGSAAVKLYEQSGRKAIKWQKDLVRHIMGTNDGGYGFTRSSDIPYPGATARRKSS